MPLVTIVEIAYRGAGTTDTTYEYWDEQVVLASFARRVDLTGWTLSNSRGDVYKFGSVILEQGAGLRLHTGVGEDGQEDLYWGLSHSVWTIGTSQVMLRNAEGFVIDTYLYQPR